MQKMFSQIIVFLIAVMTTNDALSQIGRIGINTSTPLAMFHVQDSSVLFNAPATLYANPPHPPGSGDGNRTCWYVNKAAFRTGYVNAVNWHRDSIGYYSFAAGQNSKAKGSSSIALGNSNSSSGHNSFT